MATAHASPRMLAAFASGALSEGMGLLVASHLALCPACRSQVAAREAICGALLRDGDEAPPAPGCLAGALARIEASAPVAAVLPVEAAGATLPAPIRARTGDDAGDLRWRFLLPGLSEHRLKGFEGEDVRLLRARPGVRVPNHTHLGDEATLVLAGRMRDGDRVFARGDVALASRTDEHRPEIVGDEACVCLIVLTGRLRFTGPFGRVLNLLS